MNNKMSSYAAVIILPIIMVIAASQITVSGDVEIKEAIKMTHPALGMEDCLSCHNDTYPRWPPNHYQYTRNTCIGCHRT